MADPSDPPKSSSPSPGASPAELTPPFPVQNEASSRVTPGTGRGGWQPPAPEQLQASFPQYEIRGILGRGGMGAVYLGWQRSLDRQVAIKILPPQLDDLNANFAERFKREAKAMARFSHPGIVAVHDAGETPEGLLYIVMEYIEGTDVQKMVRENGPLSPAHALAITAHVCDALAYAHQRGVIHRDIKPSNIMVDIEGRVKVADFGLAKLTSDAAVSGMTGSDLRMGTPDFIAPEAMLMGIANVDQRADLYAVGVMLYQMLTGKVPRGMFELPSVKRPGVDPRFDMIVARAMQNDPEKRYGSATEIRTELDKILSEPVPHRSAEIPLSGDCQSPNAPAAAEAPNFSERSGGPPPAPEGRRLPTAEEAAGTRGRKADGRAAPSAFAPPRVVARKSKWPLYGGIASVAVVMLVAVLLWAKQSKPAGGPRSVAAPTPAAGDDGKTGGDKAPPSEASPTATPALVAATPMSATPKPAPMSRSAPPAATPKPLSEIEKWLAQVEGLYRPMWQKEVIAPHEKGQADLKKNMLTALDAQIAAASRAAKLPEALALRNERQRIESEQGVPADDGDKPPAALKTLRESYRAQVARLESERQKNATRVFEQYDKTLATNQNALTQRQRLDEALQLQQRRDALKQEWLAPPPVTPGTATKDRPFINTLGMKFVPVPGTNILMCIHETRRRDYAAYASETPNVDQMWKSRPRDGVAVGEGDDEPVTNMHWPDAEAFCAWLSKKEGRTYRPPTDREWSFAVGIGDREDWGEGVTPEMRNQKLAGEYPWGRQWPPPTGAGNYFDTAANEKFPSDPFIEGYTDGFPTTSPVMSFPPNSLGIHDLGGSQWEWCGDWYNNERTAHILRGASWTDADSKGLVASYRRRLHGGSRGAWGNHGIRCVLVLTGVPAAPATEARPEPVRNPHPPATSPVPSPTPRATPAVAPPTPPSATPASRRHDPALGKASKDAPFTNSLGMKFVPVPGTKVLMCVHETRRRDYAAYNKATPNVDATWQTPRVDGKRLVQNDEHPVVQVSWDDANAFCGWLSLQEQHTYRLPTEHEWNLAVVIGLQEPDVISPSDLAKLVANQYPWSATSEQGGERFGNYANNSSAPDRYEGTAPVMRFRPNHLGIYDLGGNAWEWCRERVLRGCGYRNFGPYRKSGTRSSAEANFRVAPPAQDDGGRLVPGFRCVVEVPAQ